MAEVIYESHSTTLRDGAQALDEEHQFKPGAKKQIAHHLAELGITGIEAGFPGATYDAEEVSEVAKSVGNTEYVVRSWIDNNEIEPISRIPFITGLSRAKIDEIEVTWDSIRSAAYPRTHTFIPVDKKHMEAKYPGKSPLEVIEIGQSAIRFAKEIMQGHPGATLEASAEASTTAEEWVLERTLKMMADEGVDVVQAPDTLSERTPFWMYDFYKKIMGWVFPINANITISGHCHQDYGMAIANSYALARAATDYAYENGTNVKIQTEGTICGLGERCGNADEIATIAGAQFKFVDEHKSPIRGWFNPEKSVEVARKVMAAASYEVPPKSPIVGRESNVHRSGIHSDGIIKGGFRIYTPHDPRFWGHEKDAVHEDGKYQGKSGRKAAQS